MQTRIEKPAPGLNTESGGPQPGGQPPVVLDLASAPPHPPARAAQPRYLNRELSRLDFQARVLAIAEDGTVPVLERAKFLAIFSQNLDEFFQVRVGALKEQVGAGLVATSPEGTSAQEQLLAIRVRVEGLIARPGGSNRRRGSPYASSPARRRRGSPSRRSWRKAGAPARMFWSSTWAGAAWSSPWGPVSSWTGRSAWSWGQPASRDSSSATTR